MNIKTANINLKNNGSLSKNIFREKLKNKIEISDYTIPTRKTDLNLTDLRNKILKNKKIPKSINKYQYIIRGDITYRGKTRTIVARSLQKNIHESEIIAREEALDNFLAKLGGDLVEQTTGSIDAGERRLSNVKNYQEGRVWYSNV